METSKKFVSLEQKLNLKTKNSKTPNRSPLAKLLESIDAITIRNGFEYSVVDLLDDTYGINRQELLSISKIKHSTLSRRKSEGRLKTDESDKVYRLMTIVNSAEELFEGDTEKALNWCRKPAIGLGNQSPFDLADTTIGQDTVINYINRIEHGVFT